MGQRTPNEGEQLVLALPGGYRLYSAGEEYELGSYVRFCDKDGNEMVRWDKEEWEDEPQEVMSAILRMLQQPTLLETWNKNEGDFPTRTLDDLGLTYVELREAYLIAQNQDGLYELWCFIDDDGARMHVAEQGEEGTPILEYGVDLYSWCTTELDLDVLRRQIEHELGK